MLLNPPSWLLGLSFGLFGFCRHWLQYLGARLPERDPVHRAGRRQFLRQPHVSGGYPGNLAAGWAINRTTHRHLLLTATFVVTGILLAWSFHLRARAMVVPFMLMLGFVSNWIPTVTFTLAPETMPSIEYAGLGLAIVLAGQCWLADRTAGTGRGAQRGQLDSRQHLFGDCHGYWYNCLMVRGQRG